MSNFYVLKGANVKYLDIALVFFIGIAIGKFSYNFDNDKKEIEEFKKKIETLETSLNDIKIELQNNSVINKIYEDL